MPDIAYRGYTITVSAKPRDDGQWTPVTVVRWEEFRVPQSRVVATTAPISGATQEDAEAMALRIGQKWVDRVN